MSLESAELWSAIANWSLLFSLVLGVISTAGIVHFGNIKEHYFKQTIAIANAEASKANAQAAEATLKLEELRKKVAPRHVQRDLFLKAINGQPKADVEIMFLRDDPECFSVAQQIWQLLKDAKWNVLAPRPIPQNEATSASDLPMTMTVDAQPSGITVITHSVSRKESDATVQMLLGENWEKTPRTVIIYALLQSLGKIKTSAGGKNSPPSGMIRIVVAPRDIE
ncbi:Uncharacterised protein [Legionella donaldsonii]|uniref:Uncharacterized protein n=1 Tax=Legionella donaldsonii TaxID=45060 RepID=A0A378J2D7_9GAMM|nr:hypothetical protein [Legionella donaldsonii]STX41131.1 Uncharacterised protein [Legionella donaldsonii]